MYYKINYMKTILCLWLLLTIFFLPVVAGHTAPQKEKLSKSAQRELRKAAIAELVENKMFVFKATDMQPRGAGNFTLGYDCDVQVEDDKIISYLPYMGKSYNLDYGSRTGFDFKGLISNYEYTEKRKGFTVNLETETDNGSLTYQFFVTATGATTLTVSGFQRQSISYNGFIQPVR